MPRPPQTKPTKPSAKKPGAKLALDAFLPYRLSVLAETVSRVFARHYEEKFGLTIPEWRVIAVIGENGKQTTQAVIDRTRMDRVRVSRAVIRLADKGLIKRTTDPDDARALILELRATGREIYRKIIPLAVSMQDTLAHTLTADEGRQLDRLLTKLDRSARILEGDKPD